MATLTIGVFSSLVGSMNLDFTIKLAEAARKKGHDVNVWVSGNATMLSKKGQRAFKDYSSLSKPVESLLADGVEFCACEACAESRGYKKDDTMENWQRHSMDWYLAKCAKSDKILHIGGE